MTVPRHVLVIGAGIVGICCALELRRRGLDVTVVDRLEPGQGCSFGNAGILASQAVVPIGMPGLARQVPRMLFDRDSPLSMRWSAAGRALPWVLRLQQAAQPDRVRSIARAMKALYGSTVERHQALAQEAGVPELVRTTPGLYVHRQRTGIDLAGGLAWALRRDHGAQIELLEGAALRAAEPALSPAYTVGVRMGPMGCTTHPLRLVQSYAALLQRLGGQIRRAEVQALRPQGQAVTVDTSAGPLQADAVVVAAGAWSTGLLQPLGLRLPLIAERGYHLTFADTGIRLNHVVTEIAAHFAVSGMEMGLRVAGTEELGLPDDAPNWRRVEPLLRQARQLFPTARLDNGSRWMGPRPGLPDSLPALGAVPGQARVFVAAGHGHLGLTGAPHTGALMAALVTGQAPAIDLQAYAPGRFSA